MPETYEWDCNCGATGRGEASAMQHAKECHEMGYPWTNPAWPRPEGAA
jgi:hypothetical protein